jgi:hypothetical protein
MFPPRSVQVIVGLSTIRRVCEPAASDAAARPGEKASNVA